MLQFIHSFSHAEHSLSCTPPRSPYHINLHSFIHFFAFFFSIIFVIVPLSGFFPLNLKYVARYTTA